MARERPAPRRRTATRPRVTGNEFTGTAWNPYGIEGKNVVTVYFARAGDVFDVPEEATVERAALG